MLMYVNKLCCFLTCSTTVSQQKENQVDIPPIHDMQSNFKLRRPKSLTLDMSNGIFPDNVRPTREYQMLVRADWKIFHIVGDGSCAFRSVAQAEFKGTLSPDEENKIASEYRRTVCDLMIKYQDFTESRMGDTSISQLVMLNCPNAENHSSFEEYVIKMRGRAHAGEVELILLAMYIGRPIYIYTRHANGYELTRNYAKGSDPIAILWDQGPTDTSNHYSALVNNT